MQFPRMPAAVVFDMDGLLFDSEALYQEAVLAAAIEGGHAPAPEVFQQSVGVPWDQCRPLFLGHYGEAFPVDDFFAAWRRHFDEMAATRLTVKPGVAELLDTLDALDLPRAIATSSAPRTARRHLAAHKLTRRFHALVGEGDYAASKPKPDPFLVAAARLGIPPKLCLALEDSPNGVRAAAAAGMMTVMVPDIHPPTDELRGLCTFIAQDLHEVRKHLLAAPRA